MTYPIVDVSAWTVVVEEQLGASEKVWLAAPGVPHTPENRWLFKPVTLHSNGHMQGGDWAEKISAELAHLLGVPSAVVELGVRSGRAGTLSRNVRPDVEWETYTGGLWLDASANVPFSLNSSVDRVHGATPGYSMQAIHDALQGVDVPYGTSVGELDAFGYFTGFLVLDALVSNRDRHEQNWSVLRHALGRERTRLAAAYDNEGSLGYNLLDARRLELLADRPRFDAFVARGTAWRFDWEEEPTPSLVEAARRAVNLGANAARDHWCARLDLLDLADVEAIIHAVPGMSEPARRFARSLITTNLGRMRDEIC
ncbi:hypothetical protein G3N18_05640 [Microbacterium sp. 2C]|uniref:hypothetical protein n=1 Tax=Microbacterium paulum TaxID=2707006 RepID=UPI0018C2140C|nr:hypothetical protein [Microbacterium paulum]MBG0717565.1 hypothetical protein [Microbacterium paulum]